MKKNNLLFSIIFGGSFLILFQFYRAIHNRFIPLTGFTEVLSLAGIFFVILPISLLIANRLLAEWGERDGN